MRTSISVPWETPCFARPVGVNYVPLAQFHYNEFCVVGSLLCSNMMQMVTKLNLAWRFKFSVQSIASPLHLFYLFSEELNNL